MQHKLTPAFHGLIERDTQWGKIGIYFGLCSNNYCRIHCNGRRYKTFQTPFCVRYDRYRLLECNNIKDMKMGTQTWDEDCNPKKKDGHIQRDQETTSAKMGFRFCGMKV